MRASSRRRFAMNSHENRATTSALGTHPAVTAGPLAREVRLTDRFFPSYLNTAIATTGCCHKDNFDHRRFGAQQPAAPLTLRQELRNRVREFLRSRQLVPAPDVRNQLRTAVSFVGPHADDLDWLYARLEDSESKSILLQVLAYRALGHEKVKLPLNNPDYWSALQRLERLAQGTESIDLHFLHFRAYRLPLSDLGYPIELFLTPGGTLNTFVLQQYRCRTDDGAIEAQSGDIVIDAGGCYGDTALYFAHKTGGEGRVYSFEFLPENISIFERNMALNPSLADRITLVRAPLWSTTGQALFVEGEGPGTRVSQQAEAPQSRSVETLSIDDLVHRESIRRVDFIKMDIEGAELDSLKGAETTLKACRPRLAISVYHRLSDFWTIPQYLDQLDLGYRFWMRHFTIHQEETVLFAEARD